MTTKLRLGVNIDHVATLRQARGTLYPCPVKAALDAQEAGADGITLHLREDRRHIQPYDVEHIRSLIQLPMNLEMAVTEPMIDFAKTIRPHHICFVPEKREELTTEGGLDVITHQKSIARACAELDSVGSQVSLFIDPAHAQIDAAIEIGVPVVEIHTGAFADAVLHSKEAAVELQKIQDAAHYAASKGLVVHAGHGLNYQNVDQVAAISVFEALNIGHAIVAHALNVGMKAAVQEMRQLMIEGRHFYA